MMDSGKNRTLSDQRKNLMLNVISGNNLIVPIMHQLTHYRDCDNFLKWLVMNKIQGKNLIDWLKVNFDSSVLLMVQFIIKHNNKNKEIEPIIKNKDWF